MVRALFYSLLAHKYVCACVRASTPTNTIRYLTIDYYWAWKYMSSTHSSSQFIDHGEIFIHTFSHIRRPLILKYQTNELNEVHEIHHSNELELIHNTSIVLAEHIPFKFHRTSRQSVPLYNKVPIAPPMPLCALQIPCTTLYQIISGDHGMDPYKMKLM